MNMYNMKEVLIYIYSQLNKLNILSAVILNSWYQKLLLNYLITWLRKFNRLTFEKVRWGFFFLWVYLKVIKIKKNTTPFFGYWFMVACRATFSIANKLNVEPLNKCLWFSCVSLDLPWQVTENRQLSEIAVK